MHYLGPMSINMLTVPGMQAMLAFAGPYIFEQLPVQTQAYNLAVVFSNHLWHRPLLVSCSPCFHAYGHACNAVAHPPARNVKDILSIYALCACHHRH